MKGTSNLGDVAPVIAPVIASVIAPVIAPGIAHVIAADTMFSPVTDSCNTFRKAKQDAVPTVAYAVAYNTRSYYFASAFDQVFAQEGTIFDFVGRPTTNAMHPD